ncbi:hypothetical protein ACIRPR_30585 [Streptomyces griseoflavus]|uniref:hypothetical protein n=1 Tax=Streptomyces griseoflavus TaxID=35619 RepID=UPI00380F213D
MRTPRPRTLALAAALMSGLTAGGSGAGDTEDAGVSAADTRTADQFPVTTEHASRTTVVAERASGSR